MIDSDKVRAISYEISIIPWNEIPSVTELNALIQLQNTIEEYRIFLENNTHIAEKTI